MKNKERFAEIEFCLQKYFDSHFSGIMTKTRDELAERKVKEVAAHQSSFAGIVILKSATIIQYTIKGRFMSR